MKIVSWNVNGMRACWEKGLEVFLKTTDADFVCLQETKLQSVFEKATNMGYQVYWAFSDRKGYSGTACFCRREPQQVTYGLGNERFDTEGRLIILEYPEYYIVNCYVPNSKGSLERYYFRMDWDETFRKYLSDLKRRKSVIVCGDFNVAYSYIDIYPENLLNEEQPTGFLDEERDGMQQILEMGFVDTFRYLYPEKEGAYSWWSNRLNKRRENKGWRLDYVLVSEELKGCINKAAICTDIMGSDHCPICAEVRNE